MVTIKIVMVTPYFHQSRGNSVTVQRLAEGLQQLGESVDILSIEDRDYPELPEADLVHGFNAYQFAQFWTKRGKAHLPFIVTITGTDLNHSLYEEQKRDVVIQILVEAKAVHVFNEKAQAVLLKEVPELAPKTFLIPQGVAALSSDSQTYEKESGTVLFLLPAGIRKVKQVPKAIAMLAELYTINPAIRLWIVGPVIEEEEGAIVQKMAEDHQEWVTYLGQVPHAKMGELYRLADVVLNTSLSEGQSSAILEAMGMALPVVASDIPGNRDVLTPNETGFLYKDEGDFLSIAQRLIKEPSLAHSIGQAAKHYVEATHSIDEEMEALFNLYQRILDSPTSK